MRLLLREFLSFFDCSDDNELRHALSTRAQCISYDRARVDVTSDQEDSREADRSCSEVLDLTQEGPLNRDDAAYEGV